MMREAPSWMRSDSTSASVAHHHGKVRFHPLPVLLPRLDRNPGGVRRRVIFPLLVRALGLPDLYGADRLLFIVAEPGHLEHRRTFARISFALVRIVEDRQLIQLVDIVLDGLALLVGRGFRRPERI